MPGLFIAFEGVEGCGKSTQARLLGRWLEARGVPHRLTREPGGTAVGEQIRTLLLHSGDIGAETELLLMLAARAAHVREVLEPALRSGEIVISDRYELSTFAYQALGRDLGLERVKTLNSLATGGLKADLNLVLDVESSQGSARRAQRGGGQDRIERESAAFHARVAEAYRLLASTEPAVALVNGRPVAEAVHQSILQLLQARFSETFPSKAG
ncbi:MAG: dTMP kinase [Longimicrobiales bacterium]